MTTSELRAGADQERLADRLLRSTAARSYDPELDIDWSAPPQTGKLFLPEHRSTLYGTAMWERLSQDQRRELGKHEATSVAGFGIWLECILMRLLTKLAYEGILEEARHIGFARAELARSAARLPRAELPVQRVMLGRVAFTVARNLVNPEVYRSVGLDPAEARRAALANPAHHETLRYGGEKIAAFLREAGMIGPPATHLWRRSHLIA
jgi:hypothetical protein